MYEQLNTEESGAQFSALCGAHSNFRAPLTLALPKYLVSGARARAPRFQSGALQCFGSPHNYLSG